MPNPVSSFDAIQVSDSPDGPWELEAHRCTYCAFTIPWDATAPSPPFSAFKKHFESSQACRDALALDYQREQASEGG